MINFSLKYDNFNTLVFTASWVNLLIAVIKNLILEIYYNSIKQAATAIKVPKKLQKFSTELNIPIKENIGCIHNDLTAERSII